MRGGFYVMIHLIITSNEIYSRRMVFLLLKLDFLVIYPYQVNLKKQAISANLRRNINMIYVVPHP